ncbi:MAG TPA: hypothetical protein PKC29_13875 [Thermodesulfobacteriota bacterium]|nr:hypothetical protein [Thermodesulfobacteriota bacterium]
MMREALAFLKSAEPGKDPEAVLKALFALYGEIDRNAEYIRPGEREFFPADASQRTIERFLEGFRYVYLILKRAEERVRLANTFSAFREKCRVYLGKCGYSETFAESLLAEGGVFYRQSFNYWRTAFGDDEEGLGVMYGYFRACFGIIGNDDYCWVELGGREVTYDWRRMKYCRERLDEENAASVETPYVRPYGRSGPRIRGPGSVRSGKSTGPRRSRRITRRGRRPTRFSRRYGPGTASGGSSGMGGSKAWKQKGAPEEDIQVRAKLLCSDNIWLW